ncbi:hypothetical protein DACRYDRAFT_17013 [Dacryopinax primogenitus]|uniref:Homeobox domain-containing protein n=1 Tax=Dacryopinax primogenitus (strain DJM 731) TaxID=1858805 RepID=M5FRR9_DACPD|nr:uncharacterized protein DACRYDRAFT_17013 [Dacryopinax primogenitus]EJT99910.1 hypothetical protein DACRYDRAFT_17013 [Dacryopinax primogenitus]
MQVPTKDEILERLSSIEHALVEAFNENTNSSFTDLNSQFQQVANIISSSIQAPNKPYSTSLYVKARELSLRISSSLSALLEIASSGTKFRGVLQTGFVSLLPSVPSTHLSTEASIESTSQSGGEFASLRRWFLDHIDNPYPDQKEKQQLHRELGIPVASITQYFTNARRRSGWADFVRSYGGGSSSSAAALIRSIVQVEQDTTSDIPDIPQGAQSALEKIREYVSAGLEPEIRDGMREAMEAESRRIHEMHVQAISQGLVIEDGELRKPKKARLNGAQTHQRSIDERRDDFQCPHGCSLRRTQSPLPSTVESDVSPLASTSSQRTNEELREHIETSDTHGGTARKRRREEFEDSEHMASTSTRANIRRKMPLPPPLAAMASLEVARRPERSISALITPNSDSTVADEVPDDSSRNASNSPTSTSPSSSSSENPTTPPPSSSTLASDSNTAARPITRLSIASLISPPSSPDQASFHKPTQSGTGPEVPTAQFGWRFEPSRLRSADDRPIPIPIPKPLPLNTTAEEPDAPVVSRPTWSLKPAVSSTPKPKRRAPQNQTNVRGSTQRSAGQSV